MEPDIISSLFFAMKMNEYTKNMAGRGLAQTSYFKKSLRVTGKAWIRHWNRVQKSIDLGNTVLTIPPRLLDENGRFDKSKLNNPG